MAEVTLQDIAQRRAFLEGQRRNARANYEQAKAVVDAVDGAFQDLAFFEELVTERDDTMEQAVEDVRQAFKDREQPEPESPPELAAVDDPPSAEEA